MGTIAIIGAGSRGLRSYGRWLGANPDRLKVVAVAEPREAQRQEAAETFGLANGAVFDTWQELLACDKLADSVLIATQDSDHMAPCVAAAEKGYHILLEKPMAPKANECVAIYNAVKRANVLFAICHVLRYAPFYRKLKELLDEGIIGRLCSIQHLEGVAWWHFAHSYVRGNWRKESDSSAILLAKCCHDIDILSWFAGGKCQSVYSNATLHHFKKSDMPEGAADNCMRCKYELTCPYSANKIYLGRLEQGYTGWPMDVITPKVTEETLREGLSDGPYGRCVYQCDNDVPSTQHVDIRFDNDVMCNMTMSAFTELGRKIRLMGTDGYIEGDGKNIRFLRFETEQWEEIDVNKLNDDISYGHGGGDAGLMSAFADALNNYDSSVLSTGLADTLESHMIVFAAEKSRKDMNVVDFKKYMRESSSGF